MSRPARRAPLRAPKRARKRKATKTAAVPRVPRQPPWQPSPQHLKLIGVWSDREVATVAGVADHVVRHARERLGRPIAKPEKRLHHGPRPPTAAERRQLELAAIPPTAPCLAPERRTSDEARLARELLAGRAMTDFEVARTVGLSRERVRQLRVAMGLDPLPRPPKIAPPPPKPRSYHLSDRSRRAFAALPELFRRGDFIDAYGPSINPTARLMALAANGWLEPVQVDGVRWYRRTAKLQAEIDAFEGQR